MLKILHRFYSDCSIGRFFSLLQNLQSLGSYAANYMDLTQVY